MREYPRPIEIAEGTHWIGFYDREADLHCNPYLLSNEGKAAIIDAGSRADFAVVMMKALQAGVMPEQIVALIYHHPDPDLCGSMINMIEICNNPELKIISDRKNLAFISFYIERNKRHLLKATDELPQGFTLGQKRLKFIKTPYAHTAGSFVTYDEQTKTLFTSDLFGSVSRKWNLYLELKDDCYTCKDLNLCDYCPVHDIMEFHREVMPSEKALKYAMEQIEHLDVTLIAPQHGEIIKKPVDIKFLINLLKTLPGVGIDGVI